MWTYLDHTVRMTKQAFKISPNNRAERSRGSRAVSAASQSCSAQSLLGLRQYYSTTRTGCWYYLVRWYWNPSVRWQGHLSVLVDYKNRRRTENNYAVVRLQSVLQDLEATQRTPECQKCCLIPTSLSLARDSTGLEPKRQRCVQQQFHQFLRSTHLFPRHLHEVVQKCAFPPLR